MERLGGYKIVGEYSFKGKPRAGTYCKAIISDGENKYIFKEEQELQSYRELYYSKILKILELPTVEYDLAMRRGCFGVISSYFEHNEQDTHSITDILYAYYEMKKTKNMYSVQEIPEVLAWFLKGYKIKYDENINEGLLKQFMIQILLGNMDLNGSNLEIYYDNDEVKWFPFYDFGSCGDANLKNKLYGYKLKFGPTIADEVVPTKKTLTTFLANSDRKNIEKFKGYLEQMKAMDTAKILDEIKEQTEIKVPSLVRHRLKKEVEDNLHNIDSIIKGKIH